MAKTRRLQKEMKVYFDEEVLQAFEYLQKEFQNDNRSATLRDVILMAAEMMKMMKKGSLLYHDSMGSVKKVSFSPIEPVVKH